MLEIYQELLQKIKDFEIFDEDVEKKLKSLSDGNINLLTNIHYALFDLRVNYFAGGGNTIEIDFNNLIKTNLREFYKHILKELISSQDINKK